MSEFQKSSLTAYGASRILGTNVGETMTFTSIGLGSGIPPLDNLYNVTQLEDERQRFPISERSINGDRFSASCHVTNVEHPAGIYLREMGLYIADKDFPNDPTKDRLFAVTCVGDDDIGANYVVFLPKSSTTTLIDYTFTIHSIISPSAEIIIKGLDPGTADFRLNPASLTVLGGIISSPNPGKISVNPDTGEATANDLDRALNFIDNYTPYSLPIASKSSLGGLKSGTGLGTVSINDTTHIGEVIGFQALKETVDSLIVLEHLVGELKQDILEGIGVPAASSTIAGIVRLEDSYNTPSQTKAATAKAVSDLYSHVINNFAANSSLSLIQDSIIALTSKLTFLEGLIDDDTNTLINNLSTDLARIWTFLATVDTFMVSYTNTISDLIARLESIEGGTMTGALTAGGEQDLGVPQMRNIVVSTVDLVDGVSELASGTVYLVYE